VITDTEMLQDVCEDLGIEYDPYYSGRGMYGATCFSITGKTSDLVRFLRALDDETADELVDPSTDSMGYDIVFYWPYKLRTKEASF
jgi:hypothetical protein